MIAALAVTAALALGSTAADPVPPRCVNFCLDHSPVNAVFCTTADACRFEQPPKQKVTP